MKDCQAPAIRCGDRRGVCLHVKAPPWRKHGCSGDAERRSGIPAAVGRARHPLVYDIELFGRAEDARLSAAEGRPGESFRSGQVSIGNLDSPSVDLSRPRAQAQRVRLWCNRRASTFPSPCGVRWRAVKAVVQHETLEEGRTPRLVSFLLRPRPGDRRLAMTGARPDVLSDREPLADAGLASRRGLIGSTEEHRRMCHCRRCRPAQVSTCIAGIGLTDSSQTNLHLQPPHRRRLCLRATLGGNRVALW